MASRRLSDERFLPGTVVADRFRIVGIVGRGGMGEVYRADDLRLGQQAALKFLPASIARDEDRREHLFNEVRTARKVSHPNVCRVWDIGETGGLTFISMEFVDGEDLSTLLRRIDRVPEEKAIQIAHQLCAGLAAVHAEGVLHRDLKPANVMIDGRGRVRLTDFGLAALAGDEHADPGAGTPMYMAPELLSGGTPSVSTDVYALGLVLYELFTGKRAFAAADVDELRKLQSGGSPTTPTSLVGGLDPAVERAILACLAADPAERPRSALAVAAALPGGNPLTAALAAGETPVPELVAAAEVHAALTPPIASLCVAVVAGVFAMLVATAPYWQIARMGPLEMPGDALEVVAHDILEIVGFDQPAVDSLHRFEADDAYIDYLAEIGSGAHLFQRLRADRPGAIRYRYRQASAPIAPVGGSRASFTNPPLNRPGDVLVTLDTRGNLLHLLIVGRIFRNDAHLGDVDWDPLFAAAGLAPASFEPEPSMWTAAVDTDSRHQWRGIYPDSGGLEVVVEAGSLSGNPVYFHVSFPWEKRGEAPTSTAIERATVLVLVWFVIALVTGAVVARRNLFQGRGDRRAAWRLGVATAGLWFAHWAFSVHHPATRAGIFMAIEGAALALFWGAFVWMFYVAIEPYYRRTWPGQLVSWVRLVGGRFRDPLVGRDVLIGCAAGVSTAMLALSAHVVAARAGISEIPPQVRFGDTLGVAPVDGLGDFIATSAIVTSVGMIIALVTLMTLIVLRLATRRTDLSIVVLLGAVALVIASAAANPLLLVPATLASAAASLFVAFRFGVLAYVVNGVVNAWLVRFTLTADIGSWYVDNTIFVAVVLGALVVYGYSASLARGSVFASQESFPAG